MAIFETVLKSDLKKPVQVKQLSGYLFSGDNQGNKISVEVMDNGSPATLSGGVTGYVIREDNATVTISGGTLSGNKASIVLPEEAYNVVGRVSIVVKVGTVTVGACTSYVYKTSTDTLVDPTGAIPSLQELLAKISACEQATADANKVANLTVSAEAATGSTPDAVLSETGSPAHKHITFKLVKGDKGDTGDTGATPQLSIGTVTTLQPSQDATVTITGTDEEPVLNFGIPQGASGNETIDDTAGIGDTDLVYSADKVRKELDTKAPVVDVPLTTPASVQSFPDGADGLPMALTVGIDPVQDLHGQSNPYPDGGGKNFVHVSPTLNITNNGITIKSVLDDGGNVIGVNVNGTASENTNFTIYGKGLGDDFTKIAGKTLKLYGGANCSNNLYVQAASSNGLWGRDKTGSGSVSFTAEETEPNNWNVQIIVTSGTDVSNKIIYPMLCLETDNSTFAPYSNICPISGWTGANVTRMGKNFLNFSASDMGINWDGSYVAKRIWKTFKLPVGTYTFSCDNSKKSTLFSEMNVGVARIPIPWTQEQWSQGTSVRSMQSLLSNNKLTYTTTEEWCYAVVGLIVSGSAATLSDVESVELQLEIGSDATPYEPINSNTIYEITFPSQAGTVYGGTLTVNKDGSGVLTVDRELVKMNTLAWNEASGNYYSRTVSNSGRAKQASGKGLYCLTNKYKTYIGERNQQPDCSVMFGNTEWSSSNADIAIKDSRCDSLSAFEASITNDDVFLYELRTNETYDLTSGQVTALLGINNIWADTGDINAVTYPADTKLYIDKKFAELSAAITALGT